MADQTRPNKIKRDHCLVPRCRTNTLVPVLRASADQPAVYLCPAHSREFFGNALRIYKCLTDDDIQLFSAEQVIAVIEGDEFKVQIATLIADDNFKRFVRNSKRRKYDIYGDPVKKRVNGN